MAEYRFIHEKKKHKGPKAKPLGYQESKWPDEKTGSAALPEDFEAVFKWVPVKGLRISVAENRDVYEEYKEVRPQLLKDTVYNSDGSLNEEGISRLRQAGLKDKSIFEYVGKGKSPNGYNYHHLFPRALSGTFKEGPVQFGDDQLTTIHDWRCMLPLPNAHAMDIHLNVHNAMEERNGPLPEPGKRMTYFIAMPLSAKEYEMYKENPKSVKQELLIVGAQGYKTIDQREQNSQISQIALHQKLSKMGR
ncbi:MAG: hypothetical protein MJ250_01410 [Alphaproteobacteria bacterium]|nr:hypothetical protein [Alphaproteobacteria bacterium]